MELKVALLSIIFITSVVSGSSLLGKEKCSWGPSYWCSHVQRAKECGAFKHCMDAVWSKQIIKQVNPTVDCTLCQMVVKETKQLIKSNKTEAAIASFFEKACNFMPSPALKDMCNSMVKDNEDSLIQLLTSELNAEKICATMSMCQGFEDTTHSLQHSDSVPKTPNDTKVCKDCKNFFEDLRNMLMDNETREQIKTTLKDLICSQLQKIEGLCDMAVDEYIPMLLNLAAAEVDPGIICRMFGVCDQSDIYKALRARIQLSTIMKKYNKNKLGGQEECDICETVVTELRNLDRDPTTQEKVSIFLQQELCSRLGSLSDECQTVVKDYSPMLMQLIANELDPTTVCSFLGFCQSSATANHHNAVSNQVMVVQALPIVPAKKIVKILNGELCEFCELIVQQLRGQITKNGTEEKIKNALNDICVRLPAMYVQQCKDIVSQYTPAILEILQQELDPKMICTDITLCNAKKVANVKSDDKCDLCILAVTELDNVLSQNDTQEQIKNLIEKICNDLPGTLKNQCMSFVEEYSAQVLALLIEELKPNVVCADLNLCNSTSSSRAKASRPNKDKASRPNIGTAGLTCELCQLVIKEVKNILKDNRSTEAIQNALDKICSILPSTYKTECTNLINTYEPVLVQLLLQDLSAEEICSALKLCSSAKSRKDKPVMTMEPVSLMAKLDNQKMLKSKGSAECEFCKLLMTELYKILGETRTQEAIKNALDKICSILPSTYKTECTNLINTYEPVLVQLLLQDLSAEEICSAIKLCSSAKSRKDKPVMTMEPVSLMAKLDNKKMLKSKGTTECEFCKLLMTELYKILGETRTQEAIKNALDKICSILPSTYKTECTNLINTYEPVLVQLLLQDLSAEEICSAIKLCSSAKSRKDKPVMTMEPVSLMAKLDNKKMLKSKGTAECEFCKLLMTELYKILGENRTEAAIENALEILCSKLPKEYVSECQNVVKVYVKQIIQFLVEGVTPGEACKKLSMCSTRNLPQKFEPVRQKLHKVPVLKTSDKCLLCEIMMNYLDESLGENKTAEAVNKALEKVCDSLGKSFKSQCDFMVKKYGPEILQKIAEHVIPKQICKKLGLCSAKSLRLKPDHAANNLRKNTLNQMKEDTVLRFKMSKKLQLLGQKDCTYGPSYWCKNIETAKKCKAVEHCANHVWKNQYMTYIRK